MTETPEPARPMTVVRLEVDSFKRLKAAHVEPSPTGLVLVRGRNGQGKSSLLESMLAALCGKAGKVELPILEGEHGASVVVDLGDLVVSRRWTRKSDGSAKTTLEVTDADGHPKRSPQAILDSLMGQLADPVAFLTEKAADQVKLVLASLGLDSKLEALEQAEIEEMDKRRDLGRDVARLSGAFDELKAELAGIPAPKTAGTVEELTSQLQGAQASNEALNAAATARASAASRGKEAADRLERLREEVAKLEVEVEQQREAWTAADKLIAEGEFVDLVPITDALAAHEDNSRHAGRLELLEQKGAEHSAAAELHEAAEVQVAGVRREISELLGSVEFPIEGMAYDHVAKVLTLGGIPFGQASQGERLRASAGIAMAGNPKIRVLFAREGSLLDDDARLQLAQLAEAQGFQLWLEVVDSSAQGSGLWVEDGEVFESEAAE